MDSLAAKNGQKERDDLKNIFSEGIFEDGLFLYRR